MDSAGSSVAPMSFMSTFFNHLLVVWYLSFFKWLCLSTSVSPAESEATLFIRSLKFLNSSLCRYEFRILCALPIITRSLMSVLLSLLIQVVIWRWWPSFAWGKLPVTYAFFVALFFYYGIRVVRKWSNSCWLSFALLLALASLTGLGVYTFFYRIDKFEWPWLP